MNVKALAFGVLGLTVSATLTAMWVGSDMHEISQANAAKQKKECSAILASAQAGQPAASTPGTPAEAEKLAKRCEAVGVSITTVAPAGSSRPEVIAAQSQTVQGAQDTVTGGGVATAQPNAEQQANGVLSGPLEAQQPPLELVSDAERAAAQAKIIKNVPDVVPTDQPPSFYREATAPANATNDPTGATVELPR